MRKILLFGAGKSATVLIDYLLKNAEAENWMLTLVDADKKIAAAKIGNSKYGQAISFDINDQEERQAHIESSDLVISLLPPSLHYLVAGDCVTAGRHLLTASYLDDRMKQLAEEVESAGLLFLCEMGLDPGLDHMSAMKLIDEIQESGGRITSFKSHCGGLVAPESDDNPWHYKISWNPRNIVTAGKAGAVYREDGQKVMLPYESLFTSERMIELPEIGFLCWYPNRDSLGYAGLYGLGDASTFIRTTLRHPDFMYGWKNVIDLKLTDETVQYETDGKTLAAFFKEHMDSNGFSDWLQQKLMERFTQTKDLLENLMNLMDAEEKVEKQGEELPASLMMVDDKGKLEDVEMDEVKSKAAAVVAHKMHEANLTLKQLFYLGMDDSETEINKGLCSAADVLQFALEKKLALKNFDRDMIVMLHEIEYEMDGQRSEVKSSLIVKGHDHLRTAMAKTVGLPLAIAAKLLLNGGISIRGLQIPTRQEIYTPVLAELENLGIRFYEIHDQLD